MRGRRPNSEVTLQKSHPNGQPREYWKLIQPYCFRSASSQAGTGVSAIDANSVVE